MLRNALLAAAVALTLAGAAMLARTSLPAAITVGGAVLTAAVGAERARHLLRSRYAPRRAAADRLDGPGADEDVVEAYRFFLGREPESPAAIAARRGTSVRQLVADLASSEEFDRRVLAPLRRGLALQDAGEERPSTEALAWAAERLPLEPDRRAQVVDAHDGTVALALVLTDPAFRASLPELDRMLASLSPAALAKALQTRTLVAAVEEVGVRRISGYAMDREVAAPLMVELWIDGVFVAAQSADGYRRDLEERFNRGGLHGFAFEGFQPPGGDIRRPMRIEVREGAGGRLIGVRSLAWSPARDRRRLADLAEDVRRARTALEGVEAELSSARQVFGFAVEDWDAYWRACYLRTPALVEREADERARFAKRPRFTVVVIGRLVDRVRADATLDSLRDQTYPDARAELRLYGEDDDSALTQAVADPCDHVLLLNAGDLLAPDALHRLAALLQGEAGARMVTVDSDTFDADEGHLDPILHPSFDYDLLLQQPYLGPTASLDADVLRQALSSGGSLHPALRGDLWLRAVEIAGREGVRHLPRVLHHAMATPPSSPERWADVVRGHLARIGSTAEVVESSDPSDPLDPGASRLRISWPLPAGLRAAVLIPTRDRMDLLGPCLASLEASRSRNETAFEIVVVDNGSTETATHKALAELERAGGRVIAYPHPFNWSGMNNAAAAAVDADVLIFLNNDTAVLTPGWCDELCAQAHRSEIGAVGARLLFADGSIQHAGLVLGSAHVLAAHEGAGFSGGDGGYLDRHALVHRAAAVTGACLATRRDLFLSLGGFDQEALAVEANDVDYCLRVRREGLAVLYDPRCTFYHFESRSRGHTGLDAGRRARADAELAALERRWGAEVRRDPYYNPHFDRRSRPFERLRPLPTTV